MLATPRVLVTLIWSSVALTLPLQAVADDSARIRALEQQLEHQQAMMEQQQRMLNSLQAELERLKAGGSTPDTVVSTPDTVVSSPDTTEQEDKTVIIKAESVKSRLQLYGHIQLDLIHDFDRVDPDYEATLRPSTIATTPGEYGQDGSTIISPRQTLMGLRGGMNTPFGEVKGLFEFDMFGTGSDTGDVAFNFRHAWVEIGSLGFGQTNSNFVDLSVFPNVLDWWGPSGMAVNRNPQIRYSWLGAHNQFAVALEQANASFNTGVFGELSPELDDRASVRTELPDLTASFRTEQNWGHLQLAGVLRQLEFETKGTPGNRPKDQETGWGLNLTGALNTFGKDQLKFGVVYGEGIASFLNDGGVNLAPGNNTVEAVPILGTMLYYDRYWSDQWSSSIGISINDTDVRNQQADREFDKGTYASVNLLYSPYPEFLVGLEALYGKHEDVGGDTGEDFRTQLTFKHKFSTSF